MYKEDVSAKRLFTLIISIFGSISLTYGQSPNDLIDSGARPMLFAPVVVTSPFEEVAATFMPDGNTVYFAQGTISMEICYSKRVNGQWEKPNVASFSGHWGDWDPILSPNGRIISGMLTGLTESAGPSPNTFAGQCPALTERPGPDSADLSMPVIVGSVHKCSLCSVPMSLRFCGNFCQAKCNQ